MAETLQEWFDSKAFKEIEKLSDEKLMRYYFFRDEKRASVIDYDYMMSPADGVILFQKEVTCKEDSIINIKGCDYTLDDVVDTRIEVKLVAKIEQQVNIMKKFNHSYSKQKWMLEALL